MKSKEFSQKQIAKVTNTISKDDDNCVDLTSDILPTPASESSVLTTKKKLRKCNCCNILFVINFNYC